MYLISVKLAYRVHLLYYLHQRRGEGVIGQQFTVTGLFCDPLLSNKWRMKVTDRLNFIVLIKFIVCLFI